MARNIVGRVPWCTGRARRVCGRVAERPGSRRQEIGKWKLRVDPPAQGTPSSEDRGGGVTVSIRQGVNARGQAYTRPTPQRWTARNIRASSRARMQSTPLHLRPSTKTPRVHAARRRQDHLDRYRSGLQGRKGADGHDEEREQAGLRQRRNLRPYPIDQKDLSEPEGSPCLDG